MRRRRTHDGIYTKTATDPARRRGDTPMDVLSQLDEQRSAINVLEHPFYQRWSAGQLSAEELALYAGEYRAAVAAVARASELAAEQAAETAPEHAAGLARHAEEEAAHVALWDSFAQASAERSPGSASKGAHA